MRGLRRRTARLGGWTTLARETPHRDSIRRTQQGALRLNKKNHQVYADFVRLDIADHLATPCPDPAPARDVSFVLERVEGRLLTQHLTGPARQLADAVIGIVVDKAWSGPARLTEAHFPLLGEDTLRVLRILALFTCPAVDRHRAVHQHAVQPLLADGRPLTTEENGAQLLVLLTAWWRRHPDAAANAFPI